MSPIKFAHQYSHTATYEINDSKVITELQPSDENNIDDTFLSFKQ